MYCAAKKDKQKTSAHKVLSHTLFRGIKKHSSLPRLNEELCSAAVSHLDQTQ